MKNSLSSNLLFIGLLLSGVCCAQDKPTAEKVSVKPELKMPEMPILIKQAGITQTIEPDIGIASSDRQVSINLLNKALADHYVLLVQTLNYHWNLVGPEFHDYHKLFDDQYTRLFEMTDTIAERVRALGGIAVGSMTGFVKTAGIKEDLGDIPAPRDMIKNLLDQYEAVIKTLRAGVNETAKDNRDTGTSNFLTDLMEKHEKTAWMLRSLLERR